MYHYKTRYHSSNSNGSVNRYKTLFFIALLALIVLVVLMLTGATGLNENNYIQQRNTNLRSEAREAQSAVNSLSRLGASSSSAMLGKIRQYIHGIEVINNINVGLYGEVGRLYSQSVFDEVYHIIDDYEAKLITGTKINDVLSSLTDSINSIVAFTSALVETSIQ